LRIPINLDSGEVTIFRTYKLNSAGVANVRASSSNLQLAKKLMKEAGVIEDMKYEGRVLNMVTLAGLDLFNILGVTSIHLQQVG
jgi:TATA-box binding protein (TBP) (component of TFIID and TFIIIB)